MSPAFTIYGELLDGNKVFSELIFSEIGEDVALKKNIAMNSEVIITRHKLGFYGKAILNSRHISETEFMEAKNISIVETTDDFKQFKYSNIVLEKIGEGYFYIKMGKKEKL